MKIGTLGKFSWVGYIHKVDIEGTHWGTNTNSSQILHSYIHIFDFVVSEKKKFQYITMFWNTFSKAFDYQDHELFILKHDLSFPHKGSWNNRNQIRYEGMHILSMDISFEFQRGSCTWTTFVICSCKIILTLFRVFIL